MFNFIELCYFRTKNLTQNSAVLSNHIVGSDGDGGIVNLTLK